MPSTEEEQMQTPVTFLMKDSLEAACLLFKWHTDLKVVQRQIDLKGSRSPITLYASDNNDIQAKLNSLDDGPSYAWQLFILLAFPMDYSSFFKSPITKS